jgi:hypothetical protein
MASSCVFASLCRLCMDDVSGSSGRCCQLPLLQDGGAAAGWWRCRCCRMVALPQDGGTATAAGWWRCRRMVALPLLQDGGAAAAVGWWRCRRMVALRWLRDDEQHGGMCLCSALCYGSWTAGMAPQMEAAGVPGSDDHGHCRRRVLPSWCSVLLYSPGAALCESAGMAVDR